MKDKFKEEFEHIPKPQRSRNEQNLHETIRALQTFNPFFNRIERVICICLLKMGRLLMKARHTTLYKQLESTAHFFIILLGKVKLSSGGLKRVCQTGETLLEEMLFSDKTKKVALEKCKVISGTYLLEIRLEEFDKIREELVRFGYRIPLNEMLSVLKRNYIVKNWLRNRFEEAN